MLYFGFDYKKRKLFLQGYRADKFGDKYEKNMDAIPFCTWIA